jgi:hypothetical protein
MLKFAKSGGGEGLGVKYSYNRITLLWYQRSICFMVLAGDGRPFGEPLVKDINVISNMLVQFSHSVAEKSLHKFALNMSRCANRTYTVKPTIVNLRFNTVNADEVYNTHSMTPVLHR